MSRATIVYLVVTYLVAAAVTASSAAEFHLDDGLRFAMFLLAAAVTSSLKVSLPMITGTLSVNTVFLFYALVQLPRPEVISIAMVSALAQTLWRPKVRPSLVQITFNCSSVTISAWLAGLSFQHWPATRSILLNLCFAAIVYFIVNTGSIAGIVALTERRKVVDTWNTCYFWSFPYFLVAAIMAAVMQIVGKTFGWELGLAVIPLVLVIYRSFQLYLDQLTSEKSHAQGLASLHMRTIQALALAIEAKDQTTGEHLQRVQVYAREVAKEMGLSDDEKSALAAAAILHDIGKLAVPDYIISKPGKLTPEEFDKMKIHPLVGAEILEKIDFPYPVVPIVRAHHEKWDGSGYPLGLKGEAIPIGARILTAVDCLDALASDRQYRKALPLDQAMSILVRDAGKHFDPDVVAVLQRRYIELEKMAKLEPIVETILLSTEEKVDRGESPDAGFEAYSPSDSRMNTESNFILAIASARQEAQMLFEFTSELGNSLSLKETLSLVSSRIGRLVSHETIVIYIKQEGFLVPWLVEGENEKLFASLRIPVGDGLSGWVVENAKPILNGNPSVEPGYLQDATKFSTLRSALAVPLQTESGVIGAIALYRTAKDAFCRDDLRIVLALASKTSMAVENALSYQDANTRARVDGLTGLPNATALFLHLDSELARCKRSGTDLTVLVSDLNGFKQINDTLGHLVGNEVLKRVGATFQEHCREYDYVGRMGGDEFVFVFSGLPGAALNERIEQIDEAVRKAGSDIDASLSISVGFARFPEDGEEAETLLAEADRRMYGAKRRRKATQGVSGYSRSLANLSERVGASQRPLSLGLSAEMNGPEQKEDAA